MATCGKKSESATEALFCSSGGTVCTPPCSTLAQCYWTTITPGLLTPLLSCAAASLLSQPFGLTRAEVLQVINLAPCSAVEVHLIVDECEERLSEEQVTQLLEVVSRHLPHAQQALGS